MRPMPWRQLYAIARDLLTADPTLTDGEWAARIKDTVAARQKAYPTNDQLLRAMRAVEHQRPRLLPLPPKPPPPMPVQQDDPPWRRYQRGRAQWSSVGALITTLTASIRNSRR